jgi:2-C-methyl-D-erythritol 4-phosphate cytidylyltransferase
MLLWSVHRFLAAQSIGKLIIVVAPEELARARTLLDHDPLMSDRQQWQLQGGGATRRESVHRGLQLVGRDDEIVAIHDGARPFVTAALIDRCVAAAREKGAVVAGLPAQDTIKRVARDGWAESTLERGTLWLIQTPQAFRRELITAAHQWAATKGIEATDDAALVESRGSKVFVLQGERTNYKITFADDLRLAEAMIQQGLVPEA